MHPLSEMHLKNFCPVVKSLNPRQPRSKPSRRLRQTGSWAAPFLPSSSGSPSRRSLFFVAQCGFRARQKPLHMLANSLSFANSPPQLASFVQNQTFQPQVLLRFTLPGVYRLDGTPGGRLQPPAQSTGDTEGRAGCSGHRSLGSRKTSKDRNRKTPWKLNVPTFPDWTYSDRINWPSKLQESTIDANNKHRLCCSDTAPCEFTAEDRTRWSLSFLSTFSHL